MGHVISKYVSGAGWGGLSTKLFLSYSISGGSVLQPITTSRDYGSGQFFFLPFLSQVQSLSTSYPITTAQPLGFPSNGGSKNLIHGSLRCRKMILNISFWDDGNWKPLRLSDWILQVSPSGNPLGNRAIGSNDCHLSLSFPMGGEAALMCNSAKRPAPTLLPGN